MATAGPATGPRPHPTPYPDVNAAVGELLVEVSTILGERCRGMYLHGSLALGDFASDRSDIDYVVATDADVPDDVFVALQAMHARFDAAGSAWATEVEAAYIPLDALRRYDPARSRHPHIERGQSLVMDQFGADWIIQRHILREHGVTLLGPDPRALIDPVSPSDLRQAVATLAAEWAVSWWGPMHEDTAPLSRPGYQAYTVLTVCRMLYTLATGAVASKPGAARWALLALDGRWSALIERALAWRKEGPQEPSPDVEATLALIDEAVERCRGFDPSRAEAARPARGAGEAPRP